MPAPNALWSSLRWRRRLVRVFADHFLPNLVLFAIGQASAWFFLRTGRLALGWGGTVGLWVLLDAWLLGRYALAAGPGTLWALVLLLQLLSLALAGVLAHGRWRRRWSAAAKQRKEQFAAGLVQFLRSDHDAACATFTQLVRVDPWDAVAWIALGDALAARGDGVRAQRCYRRAAAVDVAKDFRDLLRHHRLRAS